MTMKLDEAQKLLLEINKTVSKMDETVRERAFDLLVGLAFGGKAPTKPPAPAKSSGGSASSTPATNSADLGEFLNNFNHDKPSDSVKVLVAWLYSQYGKYPISLEEIKALEKETGLTVPDRLDMTFKGSKKGGKNLFSSSKRGHYQLTTVGELAIKEAYGVSKGNKPRPTESDA
ncbi:MAG: hypothetical protein AAGD00_04745 [Planctomycetota bacterium]